MQLVSQRQYCRHSKFLEARTYFCNAFEERVSMKALSLALLKGESWNHLSPSGYFRKFAELIP